MLRFSERVSGDVEATDWRVEDALGSVACEVLGPGLDRAETRAVFTCERPLEGRIVVLPGTGLRTVVGTELRSESGVPIERVVVERGSVRPALPEDVVVVPLYAI